MAIGLSKSILDFEVLETENELTLVVVDSSQYIEYPERPLLEVTLPGYNKYVLVNFVASSVNTFNSNTLLGNSLGTNTPSVLPDGIWHIKYKICPYDYAYIEKDIIRVTTLFKKIQMAYNDIDLEKCENPNEHYMLNQLTRAEILIRGAKAIVRRDNKKCWSYYQTAERLVEDVLNKFCKNCNSSCAQPAVREV